MCMITCGKILMRTHVIEMDLYSCSHCHTFSARSMEAVLQNVEAVYAHDPGFMWYVVLIVALTHTNCYSFRKHLYTSSSVTSVLMETIL